MEEGNRVSEEVNLSTRFKDTEHIACFAGGIKVKINVEVVI